MDSNEVVTVQEPINKIFTTDLSIYEFVHQEEVETPRRDSETMIIYHARVISSLNKYPEISKFINHILINGDKLIFIVLSECNPPIGGAETACKHITRSFSNYLIMLTKTPRVTYVSAT
jgi:hypothetical protein